MVPSLTPALATQNCCNGTRQSCSMSLSWIAAVDGLRGCSRSWTICWGWSRSWAIHYSYRKCWYFNWPLGYRGVLLKEEGEGVNNYAHWYLSAFWCYYWGWIWLNVQHSIQTKDSISTWVMRFHPSWQEHSLKKGSCVDLERHHVVVDGHMVTHLWANTLATSFKLVLLWWNRSQGDV